MTKDEEKVEKSRMFGFRTTNKATIEGLEKIHSNSEFIGEIMQMYFTGKLIPLDEAIRKIEMQEMKFRKLKAKTIQDEIDTKIKLLRGLNVSPDDVVKIMNNKKNILTLEESKDIIQNDKTLRCFTCGEILEMRAYDFEQVGDYEKHVKDVHGRELLDNERNQMLIVLGEVSRE